MKSAQIKTINLAADIPAQVVIALHDGYEVLTTPANAYTNPEQVDQAVGYKAGIVPGTVGMLPDLSVPRADLDAYDHWYRTSFLKPDAPYQKIWLQLDGLLTIADVYLNGQLILQSDNAYHVHSVDVTQLIQANNRLLICFRAIKPRYSAKQPRAKYITRLINERHLRFIRTPVLGYTPGFSSATKPVGPYRPIQLVMQNQCTLFSTSIQAQLLGADSGVIDAEITLQTYQSEVLSARLALFDELNNQEIASAALGFTIAEDGLIKLEGQLQAKKVAAYWPHTHGEPRRYVLKLLYTDAQQAFNITLGRYGFRRIELVGTASLSFKYNDVLMYFRGACWTPMHPESLLVDEAQLRARLVLLRDAGINMLRIPGNMLYESDAFYALCDELGILVYQDFAFTNFDYPETEAFNTSIQKEVSDFLHKHGGRPCLTVLCGGSEVAQQAAMMGTSIEHIQHPLFTHILPELSKQLAPNVPYVVSSPYSSQGMPFHAGDGPSQYFGVGGYLRSFEDARLFKGRFITECLPFSHVPEEESLRSFWGGEIMPPHHPLWKDGVTRDPGSGWDFSDITDYYLEQLFNVDAARLRSIDQERYLAYSRATVVEAVETTLSIFRADSAAGRAALVWNLHDLKPGAGWGYIDVLGKPKSAFYALARTAQPSTVLLVDEGLEGMAVYLAHDGQNEIACQLTLSLVTAEGKLFAQNTLAVSLQARSVSRYSVDALIGHFVDSSYAYRFGSRAFVSTVAQLHDAHHQLISQKIVAPCSEMQALYSEAGLVAEAHLLENGRYLLTLSTQLPAYYVNISLAGFTLSDNYFHVLPGFAKEVTATPIHPAQTLSGRVRALNVRASTAIKLLEN